MNLARQIAGILAAAMGGTPQINERESYFSVQLPGIRPYPAYVHFRPGWIQLPADTVLATFTLDRTAHRELQAAFGALWRHDDGIGLDEERTWDRWASTLRGP